MPAHANVFLVGPMGSGKSAVGRRLAHRHDATFVDLDERIETSTGQTIPEIFAEVGETAFRALERGAVADLGPADPDASLRRVIASGGGAVVDPRNRWALVGEASAAVADEDGPAAFPCCFEAEVVVDAAVGEDGLFGERQIGRAHV